MIIPSWLMFLVAAWALIWGGFHVYMGVRYKGKPPGPMRQRGIYAYSKRRHLIFGGLYVLVGLYLVLMGFGITLY